MIDHTKRIGELINSNKVFVFMKGEPDAPQCGFSALVANILKNLKVEFKSFDVLKDQEMRQAIKDYSNWPTIPQVFVSGRFIGGSDIVQELFQSGELQKLIEKD